MDNGPQEIRWIGQQTIGAGALMAQPKLRPIRIQAGALGQGLPERDLLVSPQHRMLASNRLAQRMFGTQEVLVAAKQLVALNGIDVADDVDEVTYVHFLCDQHEVVFAEGAASETLYTGTEALKSVGKAAREEIFSIFPELREREPDALPAAGARPFVNGRMGRQMAQRLVNNSKLPLEPACRT
ncbi:Hint domain-containing protein [Pontibaca sp. S1109L]|uniref:Hint domain-containing protein n=2 Tax=Pontibaca salina TaxID=2795731 RepID=A0A934M2N1_9RHOB|nr:Hint domain-containing protein [Pontibaca salina]